MPGLRIPSHRGPSTGCVVAVILLAALAAGCVRPLAVQEEFFSPLNGTAAGITEGARHAVGRHRALQAARHRCPPPAAVPTGENEFARGPDLGSEAASDALAALCSTSAPPPVRAYGATSNAYRRWVEDQVRELPEQSETAAGAAGGS